MESRYTYLTKINPTIDGANYTPIFKSILRTKKSKNVPIDTNTWGGG